MLLVDADIIAYRIGWACEDEEDITFALHSCDTFVASVLLKYEGMMGYQLYLTGKGNFRFDYATTAKYKGNRTRPRPRYLQQVRQHLIDTWDAVVVEGEEADDAIAIAASMPSPNDLPIICSIDKDFDQVPGVHYNFIKDEEYVVNAGDGLKFFYKQILTGDSIDNIIGVDGMGPSGADELIHGCTKETDMWDICHDQLGYDRALENARLVFLRRKPGQIWEPPLERDNEEAYYGQAACSTH